MHFTQRIGVLGKFREADVSSSNKTCEHLGPAYLSWGCWTEVSYDVVVKAGALTIVSYMVSETERASKATVAFRIIQMAALSSEQSEGAVLGAIVATFKSLSNVSLYGIVA